MCNSLQLYFDIAHPSLESLLITCHKKSHFSTNTDYFYVVCVERISNIIIGNTHGKITNHHSRFQCSSNFFLWIPYFEGMGMPCLHQLLPFYGKDGRGPCIDKNTISSLWGCEWIVKQIIESGQGAWAAWVGEWGTYKACWKNFLIFQIPLFMEGFKMSRCNIEERLPCFLLTKGNIWPLTGVFCLKSSKNDCGCWWLFRWNFPWKFRWKVTKLPILRRPGVKLKWFPSPRV